ncbi:unnamed protein product [Calypogeia fissa]
MAVDQLASIMQELYVVPPRDVRESRRRNRNTAGVRNRAMEQEGFWSPHLPDEVLSTILAFLPLMSILRCRLVGKRWNRLAQEALFQETYARVSGDLSLQYIQLLEQSQAFAGSQLVSSVGGLLLVAFFAEGSDQLIVVNPGTATLKRIPPMLRSESSCSHDFAVIGMVMNPETNVYKILAAQEGARPVSFQEYDSALGAWHWTGTWTVRQPWSWRESTSNFITYLNHECFNVNPVSFHILEVALHDGALHCLAVAAARHFRVLRLDPDSNMWFEVRGLFPPTPSSFVCDFRCKPVLFSNKGRLMLAGSQVIEPTSIRVTVWRYDGEGAQWMQVASAIHQVEGEHPHVCGVPNLDSTFFYMHACGDYLCLGAFPSIRNPEPKVVLYNIREDAWLLTRLIEQESHKKLVYWQKRAFFYEPRNVL